MPGDVNSKNLVTVAWYTVCSPLGNGGLGLWSIRQLNDAALLKLSWDLLASNESWAAFLKARFFRHKNPVSVYIRSSIWPGIRGKLPIAILNPSWLIGNGKSVNFWTDQ